MSTSIDGIPVIDHSLENGPITEVQFLDNERTLATFTSSRLDFDDTVHMLIKSKLKEHTETKKVVIRHKFR